MRKVFGLLLIALWLPAGVAAQEATPDMLESAQDIPVEDWRDLAMGRTLTYRIDGQLWALEHYHEGTDRVSLELVDGSCLDGTWDYDAPYYCFHWEESGTACFRHARLGDEIIIIEKADGSEPPALQQMTSVTDIPLSCTPAVTS